MKKSILILSLLAMQQVHAWGERGHHLICEVASRLVEDEGLRNFLKSRGHVMGHLCNIPDIHWRSLGEPAPSGNPTHFIEPDMFQIKLSQTPTDLKAFKELLATKGELQEMLKKVGTLWWRAEQFQRLALTAAKRAKNEALPRNSAEEQNNALPYNVAVYEMMTNMGIMGHFVGDVSMPYHNWSDYDGYAAGHGGIHGFYESLCVAEFPIRMITKVVDAAKKIPSPKTSYLIPEAMKVLSLMALNELPALVKADQIIKPSSVVTNEQGMTTKTPAERQAPKIACPRFQSLIIGQMARSAKALAEFWTKMYLEAQKPDLSKYKSYRYPLQPDFIAPDYL